MKESDFEMIAVTKRGGGRKNASSIRVTRNKNGHGYANVISISQDIMAKARMVVGDRVLIGTKVDDDGIKFLLIKRTTGSDGYALSGQKATVGKTLACNVKIKTRPELDAFEGFQCPTKDIDFDSVPNGIVAVCYE